MHRTDIDMTLNLLYGKLSVPEPVTEPFGTRTAGEQKRQVKGLPRRDVQKFVMCLYIIGKNCCTPLTLVDALRDFAAERVVINGYAKCVIRKSCGFVPVWVR